MNSFQVADDYPGEFTADLPELRLWLYTRVLGTDASYLQASDTLLIYLRRKERENKPPYAKHVLECSIGEHKNTSEMR